MTFTRKNFNVGIYSLAFSVILLLATLFASASPARSENAPPSRITFADHTQDTYRDPASCDKSLRKTSYPALNNLKRIAILFRPSNGLGPTARLLKEHEAENPPPLRPSSLTKAFRDKITKTLMPYAARGANCEVLSPVIVSPEIKSQLEKDPDTLIIIIKLSIIKTAEPNIAVLTTDYFRAGLAFTRLAGSMAYLDFSTAIPLNLTEAEINEKLSQFLDQWWPPSVVKGQFAEP